MEELIEVKLTRRQLSYLVDVTGSVATGKVDQETGKTAVSTFFLILDAATSNDVNFVGENIGKGNNGRFTLSDLYTIKNV